MLYLCFSYPNILHCIYQGVTACELLTCNLPLQNFRQIFHLVEIWKVFQPLHLCHHQINLHCFGMVEQSTIVHVNIQRFFDQFYVLFTIHGDTMGHNVQPSGASIAHYSPNHKIVWFSWCFIVEIVYCSSNLFPSHMPSTQHKLLFYLFICEYNLEPMFSCQIFIFLRKIQTFQFHGNSQTWLTSRFV